MVPVGQTMMARGPSADPEFQMYRHSTAMNGTPGPTAVIRRCNKLGQRIRGTSRLGYMEPRTFPVTVSG